MTQSAGAFHPCPGCSCLVLGHLLMCRPCHQRLPRPEREALAAAFTRDELGLATTLARVIKAARR